MGSCFADYLWGGRVDGYASGGSTEALLVVGVVEDEPCAKGFVIGSWEVQVGSLAGCSRRGECQLFSDSSVRGETYGRGCIVLARRNWRRRGWEVSCAGTRSLRYR